MEKASMKIDEEKVKRNFSSYLRNHVTFMSFFDKSKKLLIGKFKIEGPIVLTEGDFGNGYNYSVKSWANIEILEDNNSSLTKPKNFELVIKVDGDDVIAVKENKIYIFDKY